MSLSIIRGGAVGVSTVVESLTQALGETKIATSKAQTYHWNVTGMSFGPLHALFQDVYEDHFAAQDAIAERISSLGGHVDGRPSVALSGSAIRECGGRIDAEAMVKRLARDERTLSDTLRTPQTPPRRPATLPPMTWRSNASPPTTNSPGFWKPTSFADGAAISRR